VKKCRSQPLQHAFLIEHLIISFFAFFSSLDIYVLSCLFCSVSGAAEVLEPLEVPFGRERGRTAAGLNISGSCPL